MFASALLEWHEDVAWAVVVGNAAAGFWALGAHWIESCRRRSLWWFVAAVQVLLFVQVGLGVAVVAGEDIEVPQFHMFYGFVALMAVGIVYSYRHQLAGHRYLLYGGGSLFIAGLAIRAMLIGPEATL